MSLKKKAKLVFHEVVCIDDGYDDKLTFLKLDGGAIEIDVEGVDVDIRLTLADVRRLTDWLNLDSPKGSKIPDPDDSDSDDDDDEDVRPSWEEKKRACSPPVGDTVLVARLNVAQHLAVTQIDACFTDEELKRTAEKYLKAQLTLPNPEDGDE